jgi:hypothetical protein
MHKREQVIEWRGDVLMAQYWVVQPYRLGARIQPERRCADFLEVLVSVRRFRTANADPESRLRIYVPAHARDRERSELVKLGVELI